MNEAQQSNQEGRETLTDRWGDLALAAGLFALFAFLGRGSVQSIDELFVFRTTEALAERGSLVIQWPGDNPPDRQVSRFSVLPSLIAIPFFLISKQFAWPDVLTQDWQFWATSLSGCLMTAVTAWLVTFWLAKIGYPRRLCRWCGFAYACGTLALSYASTFFIQVTVAPLLVWSCLAFAQRWNGQLIVAFFLTVWARSNLAILLVPFLLSSKGRAAKRLGCAAFGGMLGIIATSVMNLVRGDPIVAGAYSGEAFSTPVLLGSTGLLLSFGKGLIWHAPVVLVGLLGLRSLLRKHAPSGRIVTYVIVCQLVVIAQWWTWHGGMSWGPRLLLPVVPLVCLGIAGAWCESGRCGRSWIAAAVLLSIIIAFWSTLQNPQGYIAGRSSAAIEENETIYIPQVGPFGSEASFAIPWLLQQNQPLRGVGISLLVFSMLCLGWSLELLRIPAVLNRVEMRPVLWLLIGALLISLPDPLGYFGMRSGPEAQYRRLTDYGDTLAGVLRVPVSGDYVFFNDAQHPLLLTIGGQTLLENAPAAAIRLEQGNVPISIRPLRDNLGTLRWTIPGGAQYKQPVPAIYFAPKGMQFADRLLETWLSYRWMIIVGFGLLAVRSLIGDTAGNSPDSAE